MQCVTLAAQMDAIKKEGVVDRVEAEAKGKSKTVSIKRELLSKIAEYNQLNAEFQNKCSTIARPAPSPAVPAAAAAPTAPKSASVAKVKTAVIKAAAAGDAPEGGVRKRVHRDAMPAGHAAARLRCVRMQQSFCVAAPKVPREPSRVQELRSSWRRGKTSCGPSLALRLQPASRVARRKVRRAAIRVQSRCLRAESCQTIRGELNKLDLRGVPAKVERATAGQKLSPNDKADVDRYNQLLNFYLGGRCHV